MVRWIETEALETDPTYNDLGDAMNNAVAAVFWYTDSRDYVDEDGKGLSAVAQLTAAKDVPGFTGDQLAMAGMRTWVYRFQNVLWNQASIAQTQINYWENQVGGGAYIVDFELMQYWLGTAYTDLGNLAN